MIKPLKPQQNPQIISVHSLFLFYSSGQNLDMCYGHFYYFYINTCGDISRMLFLRKWISN